MTPNQVILVRGLSDLGECWISRADWLRYLLVDQAMYKAEVGDDVYREDPTVDQLEREIAAMMGHEAGRARVSASPKQMDCIPSPITYRVQTKSSALASRGLSKGGETIRWKAS